MSVCCITPSELGDITSNVRRSEVPQSEILYLEPPAGRITNENFNKKSWKPRCKIPEGFWNPHQSIRNQIPDRYSAAELFIAPTELWDTRFSVFFKNVLMFPNFSLLLLLWPLIKAIAKIFSKFLKIWKSCISELRWSYEKFCGTISIRNLISDRLVRVSESFWHFVPRFSWFFIKFFIGNPTCGRLQARNLTLGDLTTPHVRSDISELRWSYATNRHVLNTSCSCVIRIKQLE